MSWPTNNLGDLVEIKGGGTPSKSVPEYWRGAIPWASVKDFKGGTLETTEDYITELAVSSSSTCLIPAGSLIVPTRMALGKVAINSVEMAINQDLKALRVIDDSRLLVRYLYRFLEYKSGFLQEQGKGATVKGITLDVLKGLEIPLPPLSEQKRIAAILDKADAIRRKRQQAIKLADDFLRAVFLDMFGEVIESSRNLVKFSDISVLDAPMVDPRDEKYIDLVHIGPDRVERNTGKLLPALTAREEGLISGKFIFDDRYVLYSKILPYLRKCAVAEGVGLCSADMYPVRPVEGVATREFLWMLLLSDFFHAYTESLPARANIPKLNREELAAFTLSLPDYSQQLRFSSIVRSAKNASRRVAENAAYVGGAFRSLSQKAFSGQL